MAIIYTYPNLPLSSLSADDLLVITDIDNTNNNPTKSVKLSDIATYITNTGTGTGTTNTLTLWSDGPNGVLGDSILTQDVGATALTVTGNFIATGTGNFTGQVTIPTTPVAATDAASKNYVDTEVAGIPAGLVFKGNWNANTNTPALASGTGTVGNYYVVSVAGNTDLDGITDWQVGDWAVFVEVGGVDKWDKIDQTFVSGSGAAGQVTFWNTINTVNGDNNFFWDNTNKRLGIGTISPDRTLEVENSNGIGSMVLTGTTGSTLYFRPTASYSPGGNFGILVTGGSGPEFLSTMKFSGYNTSSGGVNTIMTLKGSGEVGIGTTLPGAKLDVNAGDGNLIANFESTDSISEIRIKDNTAYSRILNVGAQLKLMPNDGVDLFYLDGNNKTINISPIATAASSGSGILYFKNVDDNSATINGASIRTVDSSSNPSGADMRFQVATDAGVLFDAVTIDSNGFMGIGTTAPDQQLEVSGNIRLSNGGQRNIIGPTNQNLGIFANPNDVTEGILFSTDAGSTTEMIILNGGNVGIGTTSPGSKLQVNGTFANTGIAQIGSTGANVFLTSPSGGSVGIGTSSPASKLQVNGTSTFLGNGAAAIKFGNTSALVTMSYSGTTGIIRSESGSALEFHTNAVNTALTLDTSQNAAFEGAVTVKSGNKLILNRPNNAVASEISTDASGTMILNSVNDEGFKFQNAGTTFLTLDTSDEATFAGKVNVAGSTNNESALNVLTQSGSIGSIGFETGPEITGIISSNTELMEFRVGDGVGMSSPKQLKIDDNGIEVTGDIEVTNSSDGLILESPDGTRYRVTVANGGTLSVSAV